jgi:hypothetical protein
MVPSVGAGESEDAGVVGDDQGDFVDGVAYEFAWRGVGEGRSRGPCGGVRRFGGLRGDDDDEGTGVEPGAVESTRGRPRGCSCPTRPDYERSYLPI